MSIIGMVKPNGGTGEEVFTLDAPANRRCAI